MIVNRNNFPRLHDDDTVEYGDKPIVLRYENFNDRDYWYVEVLYTYKPSTTNNITKNFNQAVPLEVINKIKNNELSLLIVGVEQNQTIVEDIYRFISTNHIKEDSITLICELIDIGSEVERVANLYNMKKIKTCYIAVDEHGAKFQLYINYKKFINYRPLHSGSFKKSFLNFNRRWRLHRTMFVSLLQCKNLLDRGYVSLGYTGESDPKWKDVFRSLLSVSDEDTKQLLIDNYEQIVKLPNLYVDTDDLSINPTRLDDFESTMQFYYDTYFSVVSETCFFEDVGRFFSEKTFKAIAHRHPFILVAPYRSLEFLRSQNYKTFHPYIDESYDLVTDNMTRMKMVLKETERLSNLTTSELDDFIRNLEPIVEHNFGVLISKPISSFITEIG